MTDINHNNKTESQNAVSREYEVDDPLEEALFYVEKETSLIYEVRLFPEFALVRLSMPDFQTPVQRVDLVTFTSVFDEYEGDSKELRKMLFGNQNAPLIVNKKGSRDGRDE